MDDKKRVFESGLIGLTFVSLLTSKPLTYLSLTICLFYLIYLASCNERFRNFIQQERIASISVALYLLGILTSYLAEFQLDDALYFFRKASFLIALPVIYFLLKGNRFYQKIALGALLVGGFSACLNSFFQLSAHAWTNGRLESFYDVGRWGEMASYLAIFLLPLIFFIQEKSVKGIVAITWMMSVACLFLSGARAPQLAFVICLVLLITQLPRKKAFLVTAGLILTGIGGVVLFPEYMTRFVERFQSITNVTSDISNISRLLMWEEAISFSLHYLLHQPYTFLFGHGFENFPQQFSSFVQGREIFAIVGDYDFSFNDHHNLYLNMLNHNGLIYSLGFLTLIVCLFQSAKNNLEVFKYYPCMILFVFLIVGCFYSNGMEFQTHVMLSIFILSLTIYNRGGYVEKH